MLNEALSFWEAISGKVKQLIRGETKNAFRTERYEVTTAPNGTKIGVTLPFGTNEIFLPYSAELRNASVGDSVLVVWWGSMSNAKAYYYADGYRGFHSDHMVIATGSASSGDATWKYRKWNDGTVEAWGTYSASVTTNIQGYGAYRSDELTFPIPSDVGLYDANYTIIGQKANANSKTLWSIYPNTTTAAKMYIYSNVTQAEQCVINAYIIGKWTA